MNEKPKRLQGRAIQHEHEMIYRLRLEGPDVQGESFCDWLVEQARERHIDGWARGRFDGSLDVLYAGATGPVMGMLLVFTEGNCPFSLDNVQERPLRGDEPVWGGFHQI